MHGVIICSPGLMRETHICFASYATAARWSFRGRGKEPTSSTGIGMFSYHKVLNQDVTNKQVDVAQNKRAEASGRTERKDWCYISHPRTSLHAPPSGRVARRGLTGTSQSAQMHPRKLSRVRHCKSNRRSRRMLFRTLIVDTREQKTLA